MIDNDEPAVKLYSRQAIGLATFLGSPLAAGILIRKNFMALGNEKYGSYAVVVGIVFTALLILPLIVLPDSVVDRIPNSVIPIICLAIIYVVTSKFQGRELQEHKDAGGEFYSLWNAAGIGAVCAVLIVGGIFGYYLMSPDYLDLNADKYNRGLSQLTENETHALQLLALLDTTDSATTVAFIDTVGMVKWKENLKILDTLESIEGLDEELHRQDEILRSAYQLRIEMYQLIRNTATENTDRYQQEIEAIAQKIDMEMVRLKSSGK
jgi:hypothetical protein